MFFWKKISTVFFFFCSRELIQVRISRDKYLTTSECHRPPYRYYWITSFHHIDEFSSQLLSFIKVIHFFTVIYFYHSDISISIISMNCHHNLYSHHRDILPSECCISSHQWVLNQSNYFWSQWQNIITLLLITSISFHLINELPWNWSILIESIYFSIHLFSFMSQILRIIQSHPQHNFGWVWPSLFHNLHC